MTTAFADEPRLHYMDNLRALAMLAGVLFHAGLAYSVLLHRFWPTADVGSSVWVDIAAWFLHLFRMPLFFVVAGFFASLLVNKRGVGGMLRNRFMRVLLPFALFWPLIYLTMGWLITHAATNVENLSPLLEVAKKWLAEPNAPTVPPALMHLWFLPYLMCFCVLVWVACALEMKWLSRWFAVLRPSLLLGLVPLILVPALASVAAPFPAPESFFPQWWALLFYGFYFALGYQLFQHQSMLDQLKPFAPLVLLPALLAYAAFCWLMQIQNPLQPKPLLHVLQASLEAYAGLWMTLCCLHYGKKWLNHCNDFLRYLADASYWVYIVHLPVLFAIQYQLLDVETGWPAKFVVSVLGTLGVAFVSYHLVVRNTLVGKLLNGTRRPTVSKALKTQPRQHKTNSVQDPAGS
jgi:glucans biosynthesis protein C